MKITRPVMFDVVTDYAIAPSEPLKYMDVIGILEKYGIDGFQKIIEHRSGTVYVSPESLSFLNNVHR